MGPGDGSPGRAHTLPCTHTVLHGHSKISNSSSYGRGKTVTRKTRLFLLFQVLQ